LSQNSTENNDRDIIFISHANPQDNDFTFWLGSRLNAAGYETWSDITRLKGGEYFWQDIQKVIQEKAARVIVVMTKDAVIKAGVLDEIQTAINTERKLDQETFVIPVVYKPFDFKQDSPVQISRKNAINFRSNWADGLAMLLESFEKDAIPKSEKSDQVMAAWRDIFSESSQIVSTEPEILQSNWFEIKSFPKALNFFGIEGPISHPKVKELANAVQWPSYQYLRLIAGFCSYSDVQESLKPMNINITREYEVSITEFIDGSAKESPSSSGQDARNMVSNMVTQAWNSFMEIKGLKPYQISNFSTVWWFPNNFNAKNKVSFSKIDKQRTWCQLVGKALSYRWHLGLRAKPVINNYRSRLVIVPHVIFTNNEDKPIGSKQSMHRMRRSNCKSWYNKVWRDRLTGAISWLSDGKDRIMLPCGTDVFIEVSSLPYLMLSPISIKLDRPEDELNTPDPYDEKEFVKEDLLDDDVDRFGAEKEEGEQP